MQKLHQDTMELDIGMDVLSSIVMLLSRYREFSSTTMVLFGGTRSRILLNELRHWLVYIT